MSVYLAEVRTLSRAAQPRVFHVKGQRRGGIGNGKNKEHSISTTTAFYQFDEVYKRIWNEQAATAQMESSESAVSLRFSGCQEHD